MSKKANPTVVGGFVVVAAALIVAGMFVLGGGGISSDAQHYVLYFDGSLRGLSVGSPVTFRGIKIGEVTDIHVVADMETLDVAVPVIIQIDQRALVDANTGKALVGGPLDDLHEKTDELIEKGLRAQLETRSLVTGMLEVAVSFMPDEEVTLNGRRGEYPELPTIPSSIEQLERSVADLPVGRIADTLLETLQSIDALVSSPHMEEIASSSADAIAQVEDLATEVKDSFGRVAQDVELTLEEIRRLVTRVDAQVDPVGTGMVATMEDARQLMGDVDAQIEPLSGEITASLQAARQALDKADKALVTADDALSTNSDVRRELNEALREATAAARAIRILSEQIEQHPESLIHGKGGE